jgi:glycine oxidase
MQQDRYDVLIIGAGVIGCSIAYHLGRLGLRLALVERGEIAGEASLAAAGMLAPLDTAEQSSPLFQLSLAGLQYYRNLDQQLKQETGVDIGLAKVPLLRLAFTQQEVSTLQAMLSRHQQSLAGLEWVDGESVCKIEPLLSPKVLGALISPYEYNVSAPRLTLAYARGAGLHGVRIFTGRTVHSLLLQKERIVGVETDQGQIYAEQVILATGAWSARWQTNTTSPIIFPVKGQMLSLRAPLEQPLRHTLCHHKLAYLVPKADGSIYVGATSERLGFNKTVNAAGIATLLNTVEKVTPKLLDASFERSWTGLRPGSADGLPLLGASRNRPGLWLASGHFRDGVLLGPLTGHILAELIQGQPAPFGLDLSAFDPDRFGGWE